MIDEPVTPDPTKSKAEPVTATSPAYDPWGAVPPAPPTAPLPVPSPPTAQFPPQSPPTAPLPPVPPVPHFAPPVTAQFSAPPVPHSAPPVTAQFSAPPVPHSAPPVTAQFSAPPVHFSAPPAPFSAPPGAIRPGPYPPVSAPALPPAGYHPARPEVVAVQIAEIVVTPPVIRTPAGVLPLAGASWHVADYWQKEEKIATWALVCAIVGFFCLTFFSLFFLLVKETRHHGTVQVTVVNGAHQYVARIPVVDQGQVQHINNQVNYARSLSTS